MNADEIVRALRNCKAYKTKSDLQTTMLMASDCIEALQAQLAELRKECDIADAANTALHGALEVVELLKEIKYFTALNKKRLAALNLAIAMMGKTAKEKISKEE